MFIRSIINIMFLIAASYGSYNVITGKAYMLPSWQYYLYQLSPWILLFGSIKAWYRSYTWASMMHKKNIVPKLSRGLHQQSKQKQHTSILEYACLVLFLLSIAAICKQLKIPNSHWIMGGAWGSYFMLRLAIRMVR